MHMQSSLSPLGVLLTPEAGIYLASIILHCNTSTTATSLCVGGKEWVEPSHVFIHKVVGSEPGFFPPGMAFPKRTPAMQEDGLRAALICCVGTSWTYGYCLLACA